MKKKEKTINLVFEFAFFRLRINHSYLADIGEFTSFCLKAISEGASVDDISAVTLLSPELINEQLSFVRSRHYLTTDNKLTEKGRYLISILEFIERYGDSIDFCLDTYIEDVSLKKLFPFQSIKALESGEGYLVNPNIKKTRLSRISNEIPKSQFIEYIKTILKGHEDFIDKEKEYLNFEAKENDRVNIKLEFTLKELLDIITLKGRQGLTFGLPVLLVEPSFSISIDDDHIRAFLNEFLDQNKDLTKRLVFNLLDGSVIQSYINIKNKSNDGTVYFDKMIGLSEINLPQKRLEIQGNLFPFLNIQHSVEETYAVGIVSDRDLACLFEKKIFAKDSKD